MAWLVCEERVLASAEVAETRRDRRRGLLGRDELEGVLVLPRTRWVHTIGMRFPIDVAFLTSAGVVRAVVTMQPNRLGIPRPRAHRVVEAPAGAFARWSVGPGDELDIHD